MSKAAFALIQTGLRNLGHDPGPIDGLDGRLTRTAGKAWLDSPLPSPAVVAAAELPPATREIIHQGSARYPVREVVVHCTATRADWMDNATLADQVAEVRRWHVQDNGWRDIGYHWVIGRSGGVLAGRAETVIGAGVEGHNAGVIHICLIGGHGSAETDRFERHFTPAQNVTLRQMLQGIGMRTQIARISGHNEYAAKACPGFHVPTWFKEAA